MRDELERVRSELERSREETASCREETSSVREELMKDAPVHIREEIEADVNLGDAANNVGAPKGPRGGDGAGRKKHKKKA